MSNEHFMKMSLRGAVATKQSPENAEKQKNPIIPDMKRWRQILYRVICWFALSFVFIAGCSSYESYAPPRAHQKKEIKVKEISVKTIALERNDASDYLVRRRYNKAYESADVGTDSGVFQRAVAAMQIRKAAEAESLFAVVREKMPALREYALYGELLAMEEQKRYRDILSALDTLHFTAPLNYSADIVELDALGHLDRKNEAVELLEHIRNSYPSRMGRRQYLWRRLSLEDELGMNKKARKTLVAILEGSTKGKYALMSVELMSEKISLPKELKLAAMTYWNSRRYKSARSFFGKYIKTKKGRADGSAYYYDALCLARMGHYSAAIKRFREIRRKKLYSPAWVSYQIAHAYRLSGDTKSAEQELKRAYSDAKGTTVVPFVIWEELQLALAENNQKRVIAKGLELYRRYPSHDYGDNAIVMAGMAQYQEGLYRDAASSFHKIYASGKFTNSRFRELGRFWELKSLIAAGETSVDCASLFDDTYYSYRIDSLCGAPETRRGRYSPNDWTGVMRDAESSLVENGFKKGYLDTSDPHFRRGKLLAELGILDWANGEFDIYERTHKDMQKSTASLVLFDIYRRLRLFSRALAIGIAINGHISNAAVSLRALKYPAFYYDDVVKLAPSGLDPLFVLSIIRQESLFDPYALSYAGARGLMQVMPSTGESLASSASIGDFNSSMLYDYRFSIVLGSRYIFDLWERYHKAHCALAAYNAGERLTERWLSCQGAADDPDIFTEVVDYKQTRHYIRLVLENYYNYLDIWGNG